MFETVNSMIDKTVARMFDRGITALSLEIATKFTKSLVFLCLFESKSILTFILSRTFDCKI